MELLETFSSVRLRMMEDRESNDPPSLRKIASNTVMKILITSNPQERKVKPLVDGLGRSLPTTLRECLMPGIGPLETGNFKPEEIQAVKALSDAIRTNLGRDKMIQDAKGEVIITNDGATILNQMNVVHPAARMLVELSKAQDIEAGDGE